MARGVDATLAGGALRLVPLVLTGDPVTLTDASTALEASLLDTGMASAATALFAQQAFGLRVEHARLLSLHDLAAMTGAIGAHKHRCLGARRLDAPAGEICHALDAG